VENIHEQFSKFATEGMFRYSSILAYMFVFFQADRFSFSMQKMDKDGKPGGNILDFAAQTKFHRVQFQIVHRAVLPPSGEHAQWQTRTKNK
jgi:hypothetical protein